MGNSLTLNFCPSNKTARDTAHMTQDRSARQRKDCRVKGLESLFASTSEDQDGSFSNMDMKTPLFIESYYSQVSPSTEQKLNNARVINNLNIFSTASPVNHNSAFNWDRCIQI